MFFTTQELFGVCELKVIKDMDETVWLYAAKKRTPRQNPRQKTHTVQQHSLKKQVMDS